MRGRVSLFDLSAWCTGNVGKGKYVTRLTTKNGCLRSIMALVTLSMSPRAWLHQVPLPYRPLLAWLSAILSRLFQQKFLPLSGALAHAPKDCSTSMGSPRLWEAEFIAYDL